MTKGKVLIVLGSDSDLPVVKPAIDFLREADIAWELRISSAHRAPGKTEKLAASAEEAGFDVIIAAAGLAAHLPGVIAAQTNLPVIGIPVKSGALAGQDALYAIVQMPPGIPVATMAIDGARNAAVLAAQIIAVREPAVRKFLAEMKGKLAQEVEAKDSRLQEIGIESYLSAKSGR